MKNKKNRKKIIKQIDRTALGFRNENPYQPFVLVPLRCSKQEAKKIAEKYVREINSERDKENPERLRMSKMRKGIKKRNISESEIVRHPFVGCKYNNKYYKTWIIPLEVVEVCMLDEKLEMLAEAEIKEMKCRRKYFGKRREMARQRFINETIDMVFAKK